MEGRTDFPTQPGMKILHRAEHSIGVWSHEFFITILLFIRFGPGQKQLHAVFVHLYVPIPQLDNIIQPTDAGKQGERDLKSPPCSEGRSLGHSVPATPDAQ